MIKHSQSAHRQSRGADRRPTWKNNYFHELSRHITDMGTKALDMAMAMAMAMVLAMALAMALATAMEMAMAVALAMALVMDMAMAMAMAIAVAMANGNNKCVANAEDGVRAVGSAISNQNKHRRTTK